VSHEISETGSTRRTPAGKLAVRRRFLTVPPALLARADEVIE
jgi:hypothetical protein